MRVTISIGASFADLEIVPVTVDASAAVDAVEILIRNSWTMSDIFLIEETREAFGEADNRWLRGRCGEFFSES